jgi:hypothetical protein
VLVGFRVDQLHRDTHLVARALHRALDDRGDAELAADFPQIPVRLSILVHRGPRNDAQGFDFREPRQDVVVNAVRKKTIVLVGTAAGERQHGNRVTFDDSGRVFLPVPESCEVEGNRYAEGDHQQADHHAIRSASGRGGIGRAVDLAFPLYPVGCDLENPGNDHCDNEAA